MRLVSLRAIEVVVGITTIFLIIYVSKNVLNINIATKPKSEITSYAEGIHIVRLAGNSTQIVNASYAQYIGSTIFAKNASLLNLSRNPFTVLANEVYIYKNNDCYLSGNIVAKGKNFIAKTQEAYWNDAKAILSSKTNAQLESKKVNIRKSSGFVYNKNTNILEVYKADVWIE